MVIRERKNRTGTISFVVDYGVVDGRRKVKSFGDDLKAAERELESHQKAVRRFGELGRAATSAELAEFLSLRDQVAQAGATLPEAVAFFLKHGAGKRQPLRVPEMVEAFLECKAETRRSQRTLETYRGALRSLSRFFPEHWAHDLGREDVLEYFRSLSLDGGSKNKRLGHLRACFAWARRRENAHMQMDPTEGLQPFAEAAPEEIETLPLRQCEALLLGALRQPEMMPYVVLGLMGGIRRAELERIRWDVVDLEERTVRLGAKVVKGGANRRIVDLPENAVAWIQGALHRCEKLALRKKLLGRVAPTDLKRKWPPFWKGCGLAFWPDNGLRHTFASMYHAQHQDAAKLQAQMGHDKSSEMLDKHYRALKTRKEAERFWALWPPVLVEG